jgi:DNA polymerase III alpha subunit
VMLRPRGRVPAASLVEIADADGFRSSLGLARRETLWAIKALRDEPLPLFAAAAARERAVIPEIVEPAVALRPMTAGGEVVEDYGHVGLTLRGHPLSFLREDLRRRRIVTCAEAMAARDGRWLETAGLVLVRQMPGSAKGVLFVTIEDETGIANLVVWPQVFEKQRRVILAAGMIGVQGAASNAKAKWCIWWRVISPTCRRNWPASATATSHSRCRMAGGRVPSRKSGLRSPRPAQRAEPARHRRPLRSYRPDQGEDEGFPVKPNAYAQLMIARRAL